MNVIVLNTLICLYLVLATLTFYKIHGYYHNEWNGVVTQENKSNVSLIELQSPTSSFQSVETTSSVDETEVIVEEELKSIEEATKSPTTSLPRTPFRNFFVPTKQESEYMKSMREMIKTEEDVFSPTNHILEGEIQEKPTNVQSNTKEESPSPMISNFNHSTSIPVKEVKSEVSPTKHSKTRLQRYASRHPEIAYLLDIPALVNSLFKPSLNTTIEVTSHSNLMVFFNQNKQLLFHSCSPASLPYSFCQQHYLFSWDSSSRLFTSFHKQPVPPSSTSTDFTFVAHTTIDRLQYLTDLSKIWKGAFSIAIYCPFNKLDKLETWIDTFASIPRLRLVFYIVARITRESNYINIPFSKRVMRQYKGLPIYPINYLRDLAILNVQTTHYLNMDMDLWPSVTAYSNLRKIPRKILRNEKAVIILPAFQLSNTQLTYLRKYTELDYKQGRSTLRLTKPSLTTCVKNGICTYANPNQNRHNCVSRYWYRMTHPIVTPIPCLNFTHMEPYLIVRKSEEMPLYHPFYVNYGFNKVIFVENLRYENYQFYLMITDFGFDFPHKISDYTNEFAQELVNPSNYKIQMNKKLFNVFSDPEKISFPCCSRRY